MYPGSATSPIAGKPIAGSFGLYDKDPFAPKPRLNNSPTSLFGNPATFTAAADTQASDYDRIMKQYSDFVSTSANSPASFNPIAPPTSVNFSAITPQLTNYMQSSDVTKSLSDLSNLTDTGGYSEQDKQDIRARDTSPIRSIYASAQQNLERNRALSGGYSPNFAAVSGQAARDEADKIGDVTSKANADIAQAVAANKLAAASPYAAASASANAAKTAADQKNADIINQINQANADRKLSTDEYNTAGRTSVDEFNQNLALELAKFNKGNILGGIQGQQSLYGTTPALTSLFGNQVAQAAGLGQNQQEINNKKQAAIIAGSGA